MKNIIKEFIEPSKNTKKELWENAVFVFDTNVLLNLYRYSAKTRMSLLTAFDNLAGRVWIPYQVAYEYMRKRCEVIYETVQRYDQFQKEIEQFVEKTMGTLRVTSNDDELSELKRYLYKWLDSNKENNLLVLDPENDEILDKILQIFDGKVGAMVNEEELAQIKAEGKERYKKSIPPGYKDDKKQKTESEDNNAYGDLIIWKQIMKYAKENQKGIIYVTHDQKEDWWNIVKGKTIGPRVELRREFSKEANQEFHMYTMNNFISTYNSMNNSPIEKSALEEVRSLEQKNYRRITKRVYSLAEEIARKEETIEKIKKRILRRNRMLLDLEKKYSSVEMMPENIETQYDNTKQKVDELKLLLQRKISELDGLRNNERRNKENFDLLETMDDEGH